MKKFLAATLFVTFIVFAAGMVSAQPNQQNRPMPPRDAQHQHNSDCHCGRMNSEPRDNCNREFAPERPERFDRQPGQQFRHEPDFAPRRGGAEFLDPGMPPEIKAKAIELAKMRIDFEAAYSERPLDKAKLVKIFKDMSNLRQEIEIWRFEKRLNDFEERERQRELNRNFKPVPPAPNAPAHEHGNAPTPEEAPEQ